MSDMKEDLILKMLNEQNEAIKEIRKLFFDPDIVIALRTIKENRDELVEIFAKHKSNKATKIKVVSNIIEKAIIAILAGLAGIILTYLKK